MNFGMQTASLAIILIILVSYFKNERIPLMSTHLFTGFLLLSFFNIISEAATLYTIWHIDEIAPWVNRLAHQFFIGSLDLMIFFMFMYVDIKSRKQQRYTIKQFFIRALPFLGSMLMVLFGRLDYNIGENVRYSYGPMAMTVYTSVAIYLLLILKILICDKNSFAEDTKKTIIMGISIWIIIAGAQFIKPTIFASSLAVALMVQFLYISFENPSDFIDYDIKSMLNRYAFDLMVMEKIERRDSFYIVNMVVADTKILKATIGSKGVIGAVRLLQEYLAEKTGLKVYRINDNAVSVLIDDKAVYDNIIDNGCVEMDLNGSNDMSININHFITAFECPRYAGSVKKVSELLEYMNKKNKYNSNDVIIADDEIIDKMNYFVTVDKMVQKAIKNDGFEVFYQPIFSTKKDRFTSAEALVRLKDKETLGFVSPELFVPMLEEKGMVGELGRIVFENVCKFAADKNLWEKGIDYIEINVSGIQIVDEKLPSTFKKIMDKYKINPKFINLEITETAAVETGNIFQENMNRLRNMGIRFSMDDFGTGYSNMHKLAETKFELIKLDKSLIWPCFGEDNELRKDSLSVLEGCIAMIHNLGADIVAEGVETLQQAEYLKNRGVTYLQGYYFSRPVNENDFLNFLSQKSVK